MRHAPVHMPIKVSPDDKRTDTPADDCTPTTNMIRNLPELETLYPDLHCGQYVDRACIQRVVYKQSNVPTFARVILRDAHNREFNVVARFNGLDEQLLRYSGYIVVDSHNDTNDSSHGGRRIGFVGIPTPAAQSQPNSFVYVQGHPVSVHVQNYVSIIDTIARRHVAHRPHDDNVKLHMDVFRNEAMQLPWDKTSPERPFDLLWWVVSAYRNKTEWAAILLDGQVTTLFWAHHLCPEALLLRPADTIVRLNFHQLLDLKQQLQTDWTRQFLRKTWLSATFDTYDKRQENLKSPGCFVRHDVEQEEEEDVDAVSDSTRTIITCETSNIRTPSTHALPLLTLEHMERLYRHIPRTDGPTIHVLGAPARDELCSFHPTLTVIMRRCPHTLFFDLMFLELFHIYIGGSTILPLNHTFADPGVSRHPHPPPPPPHRRRRHKAMLRLDAAFVSSIQLPDLLDYWRCQVRYRRLVHLYHLIYHDDAAYHPLFGETMQWNADIQRACMLRLVAKRVLCVFSNESDGQVFVMTRDSLENALFYRHKLVQFVALAEERQRLNENVIQFIHPDDPFYQRLNPIQRSVFETLHSHRRVPPPQSTTVSTMSFDGLYGDDPPPPHKSFVLVVGAGGTGKTEITKCVHLVEPAAGRPDTALDCYRDVLFPRLLATHSSVTGRRFVPHWTKTASDYIDVLDLVNRGGGDGDAAATAATAAADVVEPSNAAIAWTPCRPPILPDTTTNDDDDDMVVDSTSNDATEPCISSGKMHVLFMVPMRSQRADARRRLGVMSQTYAHITTRVPHGLGTELSKTLVLFEDELSMQSSDDSVGLMRAFDQMPLVLNVKLGDLKQLDPVSPGNLLGDLYDMIVAHRTRKQQQQQQHTHVHVRKKKTRAECLATDDIDFLCERTQLVELTRNHRVDTDAVSLLPYLDLIRHGQTQPLAALLNHKETSCDSITRFQCLPLAHPDGGYLGDKRPYTAEHQRLIAIYDQYAACPDAYQILTSTNACRQYVNAFLAEYAGYTMTPTSRFYRTEWPHVRRDRDEEFIETGSLRPQANMKILCRSDFTEDGTTLDSNTIYIVERVVDVPWPILNMAMQRQHRHDEFEQRQASSHAQPRSHRTTSNVIRQPHEFLTSLQWHEIETFPTVAVSCDASRAQHTRCVVLRNQHNQKAAFGAYDESSIDTFVVVRCTDAFYHVINLAMACTMHYMQGLSTPNVHLIMERGVELHQKSATVATSRATRSVTIYSHESTNECEAKQHFVRVVGTPAPRRYTTLWYILQDRFQITFQTMRGMLGE